MSKFINCPLVHNLGYLLQQISEAEVSFLSLLPQCALWRIMCCDETYTSFELDNKAKEKGKAKRKSQNDASWETWSQRLNHIITRLSLTSNHSPLCQAKRNDQWYIICTVTYSPEHTHTHIDTHANTYI